MPSRQYVRSPPAGSLASTLTDLNGLPRSKFILCAYKTEYWVANPEPLKDWGHYVGPLAGRHPQDQISGGEPEGLSREGQGA